MQQVNAFYINVEGFREKGHETEEWNGGGGGLPVAVNLKVSASKWKNKWKNERRVTISIIFSQQLHSI